MSGGTRRDEAGVAPDPASAAPSAAAPDPASAVPSAAAPDPASAVPSAAAPAKEAPRDAPAARRLYVVAGLLLMALAAHVVPEATDAAWGALDALQARLLGGPALPAPLGLLAVAWDHWADELLVALGVAIALALLGLRMALRGPDRRALGLLYHPRVYAVLVEGYLLRGVCRSIAYTVDTLLLALPVAFIVPLGGLVAWIANAAVREPLGLTTPPFFIEAAHAALGPEGGVVALLRDLVLGIVGFWLFVRGRYGWRGAVVAVYHEDLAPAITAARRP